MDIKKWNIETYVIQRVRKPGNWYDHSTWNVNPLEVEISPILEYLKDCLPDKEPWRIIRRIATEEIVNYNDLT